MEIFGEKTLNKQICLNPICDNDLSAFELMQIEKHPKTVKYKLCTPCRRNRDSVVLACQHCGVLSLDIVEKYCRDCAPIMKKKQCHDRYVKLHPRGKCKECGKDLKGVGHKSKYCSRYCGLEARKKNIKKWHKEHPDSKREANRKYMRENWQKNKDRYREQVKIYRSSDHYKKLRANYMRNYRKRFIYVKIPILD